VADADELERIINYIEQNPLKADIVTHAGDYRFSSTNYRNENGILPGRPLIGGTQLTSFG
jgi:hypothetical protein